MSEAAFALFYFLKKLTLDEDKLFLKIYLLKKSQPEIFLERSIAILITLIFKKIYLLILFFKFICLCRIFVAACGIF